MANWYDKLDSISSEEAINRMYEEEELFQCEFISHLEGCSIDIGYDRSATYRMYDYKVFCESCIEANKKMPCFISEKNIEELQEAQKLFEEDTDESYYKAEKICDSVLSNLFYTMQNILLDVICSSEEDIKEYCEINDCYLIKS